MTITQGTVCKQIAFTSFPLHSSSSLLLPKPFHNLSLHLTLLLILGRITDDHIFSLTLTPSSVRVFSHWQGAHQFTSILPAPSVNLPLHCWKGYNAVSYPSERTPPVLPPEPNCCFTYPILQTLYNTICVQRRTINKHFIRFTTHNVQENQAWLYKS